MPRSFASMPPCCSVGWRSNTELTFPFRARSLHVRRLQRGWLSANASGGALPAVRWTAWQT